MIYIKKNTTNPILLQLTSTSVKCEFYFKFENILDNSIFYFVGTNMSGSICSWDLFELEDDSTLDTNITFINNTACNLKSGQYIYTVISVDIQPETEQEAKDMDIYDNYVSIGKMVVEIINDSVNTIGVISYYDIPL